MRALSPWPPSDGSECGVLLGPYELLERLGGGGMGHVYRARHVLLGRKVAIKVLRGELADDPASVERFVAEARAVNLFDHPHILAITDIAVPREPDQVPWFVMELLEGADLATLAARRRLDALRALRIVRQVCDALAAVHSAGIVHRDVKPANVFVTRRDDRDFVKLIDFGIARLRHSEGAVPTCEWFVGTPDYMAPEQLGERPVDHRADLYGVGSLLFELLTGAPPFRAEKQADVLTDLLLTKAPRVSSHAPIPACVRDELDALVARCLEKEPAHRPSCAYDVIAAIDPLVERLQVDARQAVWAPQGASLRERLAMGWRRCVPRSPW